jgi:hypothetical protein
VAALRSPEESGRSARTLVGAGLAFQVAQGAAFVLLAALRFPLLGPGNLLLDLGLASVVAFALALRFSYLPLLRGDRESARRSTLVVALLAILTAGVLSGLLYALAHHELQPVPAAATTPRPPAPLEPLRSGWRICAACRAPNSRSTDFCGSCGMLLS